MPELPEVETSLRGIEPYLKGETIAELIIRTPKLRWAVSEALFRLRDVRILGLSRRAKYLLIHTEQGDIVLHLGMSGALAILHKEDNLAPKKHDHIDLVLKNGTILRYHDPRRFGAWLWAEKGEQLSQLAQLGPEPLSEAFTGAYLYEKSRRKTVNVKALLMDNKIVVGVGNIYACESLFLSQISPELAAQNLTQAMCDRLVQTVKSVLQKAIIQGGTTLKDFLQPDGKLGYFAQELQVYGRKGEPCRECGEEIVTKVLNQRNTYFCPRCQALPA